jgi:plastocyanin
LLASVTVWSKNDTAPANGSSVSIVVGASLPTSTAYAPNPIIISNGGTVTWTNNDNTTHTSVADGGA